MPSAASGGAAAPLDVSVFELLKAIVRVGRDAMLASFEAVPKWWCSLEGWRRAQRFHAPMPAPESVPLRRNRRYDRRMPETALPSEPYIRLGAFLGIFALMALWEF